MDGWIISVTLTFRAFALVTFERSLGVLFMSINPAGKHLKTRGQSSCSQAIHGLSLSNGILHQNVIKQIAAPLLVFGLCFWYDE